MRITIRVTQEDIDAARENPYEFKTYAKSCPVARSINKVLNESFRVCGYCAKSDGDGYYTRLSDKVKHWVWAFDNSNPVDPISFIINVPKELIK